MSFWDKFKAGVDIGIKAKSTHFFPKASGQDVYKSSEKWEKKTAKEEKKAARKAKKKR